MIECIILVLYEVTCIYHQLVTTSIFKKNIYFPDVGDHSAMELDVSDSKSVQGLLQNVLQQYKAPPTIVVNSAGITRDNWLLKMSESDYDSVLDVNLKVSKGRLYFI